MSSSSVVGAATAVDTSNVLYPTGGILLYLKKVKGSLKLSFEKCSQTASDGDMITTDSL